MITTRSPPSPCSNPTNPHQGHANTNVVRLETESSEKPTETEPAKTEDPDVEMKDAPEASAAAEDSSKGENAAETKTAAPATAAATPKPKAPKRKSTGGGDKSKALNKKGSKAQILHTDSKPGDHYFIKLKGYPQWPCIICDETMLPQALLKSRPVSAARSDGTYREDFADGGKNVANRTFPIMYLATNELYISPPSMTLGSPGASTGAAC